MTRPPARWADCELPEELARVIASAAPTQREDAAIARMRARLHESLGPAFETRVARSSTASRVLSGLQRGKWLCAAALTTAGLSFLSLRSIERAQRASPEPARADVRAGEVGARRPVRGLPAAPAASLEPQPLTAALGAGVTHSAEAALQSPPLPAKRAHAARSARAGGRPDSDAESGKSSTPAAREPWGLAAELQGLEEIRRLLQTSPARALAAAEAQQARFEHGALGPERELLRIEALLLTGRTDEARRRATRALSASNNPPYREHLERLFARRAGAAGDSLHVKNAAVGGAAEQPTRARRH